jgi:hypothetical protein
MRANNKTSYDISSQANATWDISFEKPFSSDNNDDQICVIRQRKMNYSTIRKILGANGNRTLSKTTSCPSNISSKVISSQSTICTIDSRKTESQNVLFDQARINNLLALVRTDKFIGVVDPEYHSCYFGEDIIDCTYNKCNEMKKRLPIKLSRSRTSFKRLGSSIQLHTK